MNYSMYLQPLNSSFLSYTLNTAFAQCSHRSPEIVHNGRSVFGWICTSWAMGSLPNCQLVSAGGSAGMTAL